MPTLTWPESPGNGQETPSAPPHPGVAEEGPGNAGSAADACASERAASDSVEGAGGITRLWEAVTRLERSVAAQRALLGSLLTCARQPRDAARDQ